MEEAVERRREQHCGGGGGGGGERGRVQYGEKGDSGLTRDCKGSVVNNIVNVN